MASERARGGGADAALDRALTHPFIGRLARRLSARAPSVIELDRRARRAAVALILRVGGSEQVELLLIKRATWEGDPWSGQIALPGGRHEGGETLVQTAVREAREETAIDLARDGVILGPLDDVQPHSVVLPRLVITPFVGAVGGVGEVTQSEEVAEAFWMPVNALRAPGAAREVILELAGGPRRMPSFQYRGYTIWGLTERILEQFLALTTDE